MSVTNRTIARFTAGAALLGLLTLGAVAPAQAFNVAQGPYAAAGTCNADRTIAVRTYPTRTASGCIRDKTNGQWYFIWLSW